MKNIAVNKRLIISLLILAGLGIAVLGLSFVLSSSNFRIGLEGLPAQFNPVLENASESVVGNQIILNNRRATLFLTATPPAVIPAAPLNAPPGEHLFAALDPLLWIHNENLLPVEPGERAIEDIALEDIALEEIAEVLAPFRSADERFYPIAVPGDYPELFLPVLIMLSEALQGFVDEDVFASWDALMANPRSWRDSGYFDRAYELLDEWANRGIISPQWWDMDEPAYRDAALEGRAGLFPHFLSWKRQAPAEERFYWKIIPAISGAGVRNVRPVIRAAIWSNTAASQLNGRDSDSGAATNRRSESAAATSSSSSIAGLLEKLPQRHRDTAARLIRAVQGRASRERIITLTGWTPAILGGTVINKEDRDARTLLASADSWIIVR